MHFRSSLLLFALAALARAQTTPAASPVPGDAQVHLETVVITASPLDRSPDEISTPTSVLAAAALDQRRQSTLGETLAGLPGVDSTYFGPGASRPVIRGLGGDRVRVLTGGVGTLDASVVSPDHAVSLEPLLIERVEVVRGPATLLYGGGAIGGVVNVVDGRIPEELPPAAVTGRFEVRGTSAADERAAAGVLAGAAGRWAWRLDGFRRTTGNVKIPGLAPTPAKAAELIAAGQTPADGVLINSATAAGGGAGGLSYLGRAGHFGVAYSGFDSLYGTVAEPDVRIELKQRRVDLHGEWLEPAGWVRAVKFEAGFGAYRHDELEGADLGTRFTNRGYEGRLEFLHGPTGSFEGALGLQAQRSDFAAMGEEAFLPPTVTNDRAVFLYEETVRGPVTWQFGARAGRQTITPEAGSGLAQSRHSTTAFTGGAVWKLNEEYALAVSLSLNERAPNAQELHAHGPHVGTNAYEVGEAGLVAEKSTGFDVSLRRRRGFVTGELSIFLNRFDGYIYEEATGAMMDGLPVFAFVQRGAELCGGEMEAVFHLQETKEAVTHLRLSADMVRATNTTNGTPLPRTTPVRFGAGLDWRRGPWAVTADWRQVRRQDRVAAGETPTTGYDLGSAQVTWRFGLGRTKGELFLRATNLLDETARVHASFLKDIAPLPGRDATAGVRLNF